MNTILPTPSKEQEIIIKEVIAGKNVIINSVAGSGKTTTIMHIAKSNPNKLILLLTYNARLKLDSKTKARNLKLGNLEIHTYHAYCVKYYDRGCWNDTVLLKLLNKDTEPMQCLDFDIIIIDEAQDMDNKYYRLVKKIIKDNNLNPQMVLVGDIRQNIYEFKGSDYRFMTLGDKLFDKCNDFDWVNCKLSTSYRITHQIAKFLNNCVLEDTYRINAQKDGPSVQYYIANNFNHTTLIKKAILPLFKKYKPHQIFILNTSIKSTKGPVRNISNTLSNTYNIPIYASVNEDEELNEEIIKNKLVISTFHQTKGLEREVVIVLGFDSFYYNYGNNTDKDTILCPNDVYVALTRAKRQLVLVHGFTNNYLPFLNKLKLCNYVRFNTLARLNPKDDVNMKPRVMAVTDLVERLSPEISEKCIKLLKFKIEKNPKQFVDIQRMIQEDELSESVVEINGIAITSYYELKCTGKMTIVEQLKNNDMNISQDITKYMFQNKLTMPSPELLLKISNYYCAYRTGYIHKVNQIKNYDWITQKQLDKCCKRLEKLIHDNSIYEFSVETCINGITIYGSIDCVDPSNETVWEFKCVKELEAEHILQLVIYAYLLHQKYRMDDQEEKIYEHRFMLYNILSRQTIRIYYNENDFRYIIEELLAFKYNRRPRLSDQEFLMNNT